MSKAVTLTNPDRVLWPSMGLTKADLADYYRTVADVMMPHIIRRPVTLVRCPQGRQRKCFYQRHHVAGFPEQFHPVDLREATGEAKGYLYIEEAEGLIAGVQFGVLEFHIWGSTIADIERPDRLVFDLDPDPELDFAQVRQAAVELASFIGELGLTSWPMLTGGKGVHVVAPLEPKAEWPEAKAFARSIAGTMAQYAPDRFVDNMAKVKRKGRIFIDYLRNDRTATAIAPWSTRAREGAPVAWPLDWDQLKRAKSGADYNVEKAMRAVKRMKSPPWQGYEEARRPLPAAQALAGAR
jgi:bifunctional non-homologous end joining protein LigD